MSTVSGDYFDIDRILSEHQKIPIVFKEGAKDLGFLYDGEKRDIPANTTVDLPFWAVSQLAIEFEQQRQYGNTMQEQLFVHPDWPLCFKPSVRKVYAIDETSSGNSADELINLYELNPYFYQLGLSLITLFDDAHLAVFLGTLFTRRMKQLLNISMNSCDSDIIEIQKQLDITERTLFRLGYDSSHIFQRWKDRKLSTLNTSAMYKESVQGNKMLDS